MDVFLHVGPHKSGTCSIQFVTRKHFGSDRPKKIWYPTRDVIGNFHGHAGLADPFIRRKKATYDPDRGIAQLEAIRASAAPKVQKLIISSENFSYAPAGDLERIGQVFAGDNLHLVFTVSPLAKRAVSIWGSAIRYGRTARLEKSLDKILGHDIFNPAYFSKFVQALAPEAATLIVSDPKNPPEQLLQDFFDTCGLAHPRRGFAQDEQEKKNISPGRWEAEVLLAFNRAYRQARKEEGGNTGREEGKEKYFAARNRLIGVFQSPEWRAAIPKVKLSLPENFRAPLAQLGRHTRADIGALIDAGRLSVRGELEALFAGLGADTGNTAQSGGKVLHDKQVEAGRM